MTPSSPRLAALRSALDAGDSAAVATFWRAIDHVGTPLVEPIAGDDAHVLVTFVWRQDHDRDSVVVLSDLVGWHIPHNRLQRLGASDVWSRTYRVPADARFTYLFSLNDDRLDPAFVEADSPRSRTYRSDPFDRRLFPTPTAAGTNVSVSAVELPTAPPQPWLDVQAGVPTGRVEQHTFASTILANERELWVYLPAGYAADAAPYRLLLLFDGWDHTHLVPTPTILDNLIAHHHVPPVVAVLLGNAGTDPAARQRELDCNPQFATFLRTELLPWVQQHYAVTTDARHVVVGGWSSGGLAALYAGLHHPDRFGNILSQSAPLYWRPDGSLTDPDPEPEWLSRQFPRSPRLPLRIYLEVGTFEAGRGQWSNACPDTLVANRHLRNVLEAKGYAIAYSEYHGGHDFICWRGTLADGLVYLLNEEAAPQPT